MIDNPINITKTKIKKKRWPFERKFDENENLQHSFLMNLCDTHPVSSETCRLKFR